MHNRSFRFTPVLLFLLIVPSVLFAQNDWPRWRGPNGNGVAVSQTPPTTWSADDNVIWKTKVPGRGHASPIIVGGKIFLATSDKEQQAQSVVCFDLASGTQVWESVISTGGLATRIHRKNTHASSTIATDGEHVFAVFEHDAKIRVAALDFKGEQVWTKIVGSYKPQFQFGYGSSPIVNETNVIVTNEGGRESAVVAYDTKTGDEKWRIDRKGGSSFSTPVVANIAGKDQLFLSGGNKVFSYDPSNGKSNWSTDAAWFVTCGTLVWDTENEMVFASGGFPDSQTLGINVNNGQKVWDNGTKAYEQSMLATGGYLYAHADNGVLYCWNAKDGKEMWKQKFSEHRNGESASPVLANGNIYFTAEDGETVVVKATPDSYQEVARNELGTESFASHAFCGNKIYARVADSSGGSPQEWLYCLGDN